MFELAWDNTGSGVTVTANLKIIGTSVAPPQPVPQPGTGFKRLRLPDTVVAAPATVTAANAGGAQ